MLVSLLLALLIGYFLYSVYWKRFYLPPGPFPLPLIGNLHQFYWYSVKYGNINRAQEALKKEYGPVFTLWLGSQPTVHIGTMDLAQETMIKRGGEFVDRFMPFIFNTDRSPYGITSNSGEIWQTHRRFSLQTLRNFGIGKSVMEGRIMAEFNARVEDLDKTLVNGTGVLNTYDFLNLTVGSIINRILFSVRFEKEDEADFFNNKKMIDRFSELFTPTDFLLTHVWMFFIPFLSGKFHFLGDSQKLKDFFRKQIKDRLGAIASGDHIIDEEPADYVDAFVMKMEEEKEKRESSFNPESLLQNIVDIWIAGQATTVATLTFGMGHLLNNPEILEKVRRELQEVTSQRRKLSLQDKLSTPYFVATLHEIQRHSSLLNINFFRTHSGDTTVGGYPVLDGTPITAELTLIMRDEQYFKEPEKFNPDRFIEDPKLEQHMVPFGMGKRQCMGESLARAELYLLLGNFILRYNMEPIGRQIPSTKSSNDYGCFSIPCHFDFKVTRL